MAATRGVEPTIRIPDTVPESFLTPTATESRSAVVLRHVLAVTRLSLGFVFLWAFFDKLLGLGRATPAEGAWIDGGSPTEGFLTHGVKGPSPTPTPPSPAPPGPTGCS